MAGERLGLFPFFFRMKRKDMVCYKRVRVGHPHAKSNKEAADIVTESRYGFENFIVYELQLAFESVFLSVLKREKYFFFRWRNQRTAIKQQASCSLQLRNFFVSGKFICEVGVKLRHPFRPLCLDPISILKYAENTLDGKRNTTKTRKNVSGSVNTGRDIVFS